MEIPTFLETTGWGGAEIVPLKADFSTRRFYRVKRGGASAIVMCAAPDQKTREFAVIANLLRRCGLAAPEVYAIAPVNTLHTRTGSFPRRNDDEADDEYALLEDLGDVTFGALMDTGRDPMSLYHRAADVLAHLHRTFDVRMAQDDALPTFDPETFVEQTGLFLDFYVPYARGREASPDERADFQEAWRQALAAIQGVPLSLMLRDFMPDNIMDVPEREGLAATGLVDFQDGGIGPVAYDVASLCECVRRDVGADMLDAVTAYYHKRNPVLPLDNLRRACVVLSAQRHMRVLGIIVRLATTQGRTDKLASLQKMESYLFALLRHDALQGVKDLFVRYG